MNERRVRRLMIHPNVLLTLLRSGRPVRFSGLPADARLVGANYDVSTNQFVCLVESATFGLVPEGDVIPGIAATVAEEESNASQEYYGRLAEDDRSSPVRRVRLSGGKPPESPDGK